jgi:hypothetical protein
MTLMRRLAFAFDVAIKVLKLIERTMSIRAGSEDEELRRAGYAFRLAKQVRPCRAAPTRAARSTQVG